MARRPCCHKAYNVVATMNIFTNTGDIKDYKTVDVNGGMKLLGSIFISETPERKTVNDVQRMRTR